MSAPQSIPAHGTKGTHVIKAQEWLERRLGTGAYSRLCREAGAVGDEWSVPMASGWYPVPKLVDIFSAAGAEAGLSVQQVSNEVARLNADHDLRTIYRVFMSVMGPVSVLKWIPQIYKTYINFGEAGITVNEPGLYDGYVNGVPHRLIPWMSGACLGFLAAAIEAAGGKKPVGTIPSDSAQPDGSYSVRFVVRYQL